MFKSFFTLEFYDDPPRKKVHLAVVAREVEVLAPVHDRRAGRSHVDRLGAVAVEEFHGLAELRAAYDRVVHEEQVLSLDELGHRDLLHLRHLVALLLGRRHEASRPGRSVLYERPRERPVRLVGVAYRVRCAAVRNSAHVVDLGDVEAVLDIVSGHDAAVVVAHHFDVDALVGRGRVAVVAPEEGADLHLVSRRHELGAAARREFDYLARTEIPEVLEARLEKRKRLKAHG